MKLRSVIKIHGGKFYLKDFIINQFPTHSTYIEPFGGSASVLINKSPSKTEIYNDLHAPTANIFFVMKNNSKELIEAISKIEYNEDTFNKSKNLNFIYGSVESAVGEIILRRMSRGGMKKNFSWSKRLRGGQPGDVNAFCTFKKILPLLCERIKNVEIYSHNALDLIKKYLNDESNLLYLDPPYLKKTRIAKNVYDCEMTEEEHIDLAKLISNVKSKILISCYDSVLYKNLYKDWCWLYKNMPNNSGQSKVKQRRIECLVKNF